MLRTVQRRLWLWVPLWLAGIAAIWVSDSRAQIGVAQRASNPIALTGGRVIASPDAEPLDNATIVIVGGRIREVGPRGRVTVPTGATIIDCTGLVVVAGFQNSHVHFTEDKWTDASAQPASKLTAQLRAMLTGYGFTTVVDTASLLANTVALRRRIDAGEVDGPRILTAGLPLYPPAGIPYYVKDVVPAELIRLMPQPETAAEAAGAVRANLDGGADIIKLFTGSWVTPRQVLPMSAATASAAVAEAHRRDRLVVTHPSNVAGLEVALDARVDVLAHAIDDVRGLTPDHLKRMKEQRVALVPTLKLLAATGRREVLDQVRDYARIGGPVLFGTDVGYLTDYDPAREYQLLDAAGLTWRQILASLTTGPAATFAESGRYGRLTPGMQADVVVLGTDPALGSRAFTDVRYAIKAGHVIYQR
jgi:imidazolonepropionase-like amidohydrolase